jgi:hypothetical protein
MNQLPNGVIRLGAVDRSTMPAYTPDAGLASEIANDPTYSALAAQTQQERQQQAMSYGFIYGVSGSVPGLATQAFNLLIEAGSDFQCLMLTASAFSYDAVNATIFPIPNSLGITAAAGDGLSVQITDTTSGRQLTNGFISMRNFATPGYGVNFTKPLPWKYHFRANSILRFDVRSRETNALRIQNFEFALIGVKTQVPR